MRPAMTPDIDGSPGIAQLVACEPTDMTMLRIVGGRHFGTGITPLHGRVLHDYLDGGTA